MTTGEAWSDEENDLIVQDYFDMLRRDLAKERYVKVEFYRSLHGKLPHRSIKSIEFKHQNITAVMIGMGEQWIEGLKPKSAFQLSLVDAVWRQLQKTPEVSSVARVGSQSGFDETSTLWLGPPPTLSNAPPILDKERSDYIAKKFDVAGKEARNKALGDAGESFILEFEKHQLRSAGRTDLADKVTWVARELGDGLGYDIHSFDGDGRDRLLEVKTTNGWERSPFHITQNELKVADENRETWKLVRLWNFSREPKGFELQPPLERHVELTPTSFLASLDRPSSST